MNDIEILRSLSDLPLNIILIGVVIALWRKLSVIESKYENVLLQLGQLQGSAEVRAEIKQELIEIKTIINARKD